jgi:hypothetical protein
MCQLVPDALTQVLLLRVVSRPSALCDLFRDRLRATQAEDNRHRPRVILHHSDRQHRGRALHPQPHRRQPQGQSGLHPHRPHGAASRLVVLPAPRDEGSKLRGAGYHVWCVYPPLWWGGLRLGNGARADNVAAKKVPARKFKSYVIQAEEEFGVDAKVSAH